MLFHQKSLPGEITYEQRYEGWVGINQKNRGKGGRRGEGRREEGKECGGGKKHGQSPGVH